MKYLKTKWAVLIAIVAAVAVFAAFSFGHSDKQEYFTAKAERGDIHDVVEATGTINAVTAVQVGSQVSGTISKLYADFNSPVKKGQVIAQIDPSLFEGALLQAKADLQNAVANEVAAKANLVKARATYEQAQQDYQRTVQLVKEGVFSQQQLDQAKATNDTALAAVNAAQAQLTQATAQTAQKKAAVDVAQTNLDHTIIRAPIDGVVTARNVDVGQTVAASLQAPTLFNIAQDLRKMQVDVSTDESDVGQIKVGQQATFTVDAFPRQTFTGRVAQIRMNPTTVQNVVTYDTVIQFDNPEMKLFPGMTAYVTIPVANAGNVLKVPNGALRFTPDLKPEQLNAIQQKYGIQLAYRSTRTNGKTGAQGQGQQQQRQAASDTALVWKLAADKSLQPVQIKTGITDHTFTAVEQTLKGQLNPGDQLVIGSASLAQKSATTGAPGMGRMGR
ncbi:MAG: efflux RND transporter periplasmic adaptor subunit [Terriglobales bacterium]